MGQANDAGLGELLKAYGFSIGQDFVFDRKAFHGPVDVGGGQLRLRTAPMFVGVEMPRARDKDFGVLAGINAIVFPYPSSVELVGPLAGGKPAQGKLWRLAESTPASWKVSGFFFYSNEKPPEETKDKGPFGIAYAYEGPLKSAYAPAAAAGMSSPDAAGSESKKPVRLLVAGDSDFASDEYVQLARNPILGLYGSGAQMLFNAIGWTLEDEALTPVRTKTMTARPISVDSDRTVVMVKALNIAVLPIAFCVLGVVLWRLRLARRQTQRI
jgi:ABC-type uncharacterized transport system involved in gliding motility auxiliary subunit